MGEIQTDTRIRIAGGGQLPGQARLPELDGVDPYSDPLLDRVGRMVGEHPLAIAGATLAGGIVAARSGSGLLSSAVRGAGGLAAGFVGALAIGSAAQRWLGGGATNARAYVDQSPESLMAPSDSSPEHLRVMDWNVHELIGVDGNVRMDDSALAQIRETVQREHPDVLLLQEVRSDAWISGGHDNLQELADALGATSAVLVGNGTRPNGTQKGQAVLTFGDTRVQDARGLHHIDPTGQGLVHDLRGTITWGHDSGMPLPDLGVHFHPRTTADAMITTPSGQAVRVLNVHLSGTGGAVTGGTPGSTDSQVDQLVPIADTLDAWDGPTLLAGDFNVLGGTRFGGFEARVLGEHGLRDLMTEAGVATKDPRRHSFSATDPSTNLDRIYGSRDVSVTDARVLQEIAGPDAGSDHLPVVADVEIG